MREIKFRAWDKERKIMLFKSFWDRNWYFTPSNDVDGCHTDNLLSPDQKPYYEIMQYTGLKDCKGKEIYEGDLVKVCGHYEGDHWENEEIIAIEYEDGSYQIDSCDIHNYGIKIIGNVYENPELMEGDKK